MYSFCSVALPRTTEWSPQAASSLVRAVLEDQVFIGQNIQFVVWMNSSAVGFEIIVGLADQADRILSLVKHFYPLAEAIDGFLQKPIYPLHRRSAILRRNNSHPYDRIPPVEQLPRADPLILLTQVGDELRSDETLVFKLDVRRRHLLTEKEVKKALTQTRAEAGIHTQAYPSGDWAEAFGRGIAIGFLDSIIRVPRFSNTEEAWQITKLTQQLYETRISLRFDTPDQSRLHVFSAASAALNHFSWLGESNIASTTLDTEEQWADGHPDTVFDGWIKDWLAEKNDKRSVDWYKHVDAHTFYLIPEEIAAMWHLPHAEFKATHIPWLRSSVIRIPRILVGKREGICLGNNIYGGQVEQVYLPSENRATHLAIVGSTGAGKTTLLHNLIAQDIAQGNGVAVIDPTGNLIPQILQWSIPVGRETDVVVLDLGDENHPPPFNVLRVPNGTEFGGAVSTIVDVLNKLGFFANTVSVEPALEVALRTLEHETTPTLRDVVRLFNDDSYRDRLLSRVTNAFVEDFWNGYEDKKASERDKDIGPLKTRLSRFYGSELLYPVTCHPDNLDFFELIKKNKIILISLKTREGTISLQQRNVFGAFVITQLQFAAMSGAAKASRFYLYIDEVEQFITAPLDEMFSRIRQYNLSLTVANQYLDQLDTKTLPAIMGNVGALISLQLGDKDAKVIDDYMRPSFDAVDLMNLDLFTAAVRMRYKQEQLPAFSLRFLPPLVQTGKKQQQIAREREEQIRQHSIKLYTPKTKDEVLAWLAARYPKRSKKSPNELEPNELEPSDYDKQ